MASTTALIIGGLSALGAIGGSAISANAAGNAASEQQQSAEQAIQQTQQNEQPYLGLGTSSVSQLQTALQNGTFGPGSLPGFTLPTEAQAQATPGFQFTEDQGELGVSRQAAAAGGAFTGGTVKAGAQYAAGLASGTYQNSVQNSLQAYQANLAKQSQEFQQLYTPVQIGANTAAGTSSNIANLMTQIGNAQAAGTVGQANAITSGINGGTSSLLQTYLLNNLLASPSGAAPGGLPSIPASAISPLQPMAPPPTAPYAPPLDVAG